MYVQCEQKYSRNSITSQYQKKLKNGIKYGKLKKITE